MRCAGYQDLSSRLVKALREAIETDLGENSESEVRGLEALRLQNTMSSAFPHDAVLCM